MMQVHGHTFLVSGGSSGLGAACARMLANAGANVAIADINRQGESLAGELGARARFVSVDVTDETPCAPAGWYPNPLIPGQQRYWDGNRWTEHNAPLDPPPPPIPRQPRERFRFTRRWVIALVIVAVLVVGEVTWSLIDSNRQAKRDRAFYTRALATCESQYTAIDAINECLANKTG